MVLGQNKNLYQNMIERMLDLLTERYYEITKNSAVQIEEYLIIKLTQLISQLFSRLAEKPKPTSSKTTNNIKR
jgi:hypothetical protein